LGLLALLSIHVADSRAWNLDGLFYAACLAEAERSSEPASDQVYAELDRVAPVAARNALEASSAYRRRLKNDAAFFELQLPFYRAKPLYVASAKLARAFGASVLAAPYWVSTTSYALIGLCVAIWAIQLGAWLPLALTGALLLMASPQMRDAGALATPDMSCALWLLLGLMLSRKHFALPSTCFVLAILTRPDAVVFAIAFLSVQLLRTGYRTSTLAMLVILPIVAFATSTITHAYGWAVVMRHTFVKALADRADLELPFGIRDYFRALSRGLRGHGTLHVASFLPFFAPALLSVTVWGKQAAQRSWRHEALDLAAVWLGMAAHVLVFPMLADRFFVPAYVATVPLSLALLARRHEWASNAKLASRHV
jgi:hypothetical protein